MAFRLSRFNPDDILPKNPDNCFTGKYGKFPRGNHPGIANFALGVQAGIINFALGVQVCPRCAGRIHDEGVQGEFMTGHASP